MTGTVHAALGAAIGKVTNNALLAFALGVVSHYVGDVIPHKDVGPIEAPTLLGTMGAITWRHGWKSPQFWGALGAICPDFEHIPAELRRDPRRFDPMPEKFFPTHNGRAPHAGWPYSKASGVAMQAALLVVGLYIAGTLSKNSPATK